MLFFSRPGSVGGNGTEPFVMDWIWVYTFIDQFLEVKGSDGGINDDDD